MTLTSSFKPASPTNSGCFHCACTLQSVIPLWKELISMGTNDFLENYYIFSRRSSKYSIEEYQNFLVGIAENFVKDLYQLGARKISIVGLAPVGCLPLERTTNVFYGSTCVEEYNDVAKTFNKKLQDLINQLEKELREIQLAFSNPHDIVTEIIQNPDQFGFENVRQACCGTGYLEVSYMCNKRNPFTCSDASTYVFWDSFHPTEKTNAIVAEHVIRTSLSKFQ